MFKNFPYITNYYNLTTILFAFLVKLQLLIDTKKFMKTDTA